MASETVIEWTDHTFNPWRGCAKVHAGCTHCYAEKNVGVAMHGIRWGEVWSGGQRVVKADSQWGEPRTWARAAAKAGVRRRVFCASLSDVLEVPAQAPFHRLTTEIRERVTAVTKDLDAARARLWDVIRETAHVCQGCLRPHATSADLPGRTALLDDLDSVGAACDGRNGRCTNTGSGGLDWLLLTKRPENWSLVPEDVRPLVWLGTSISDQVTADEMVPRLLQADGFRCRFVSAEPLVGRVDLRKFMWPVHGWWRGPYQSYDEAKAAGAECGMKPQALVGAHSRFLDWVIVGGESGRKARQCHVEWVRDVVRQCREAGVPCFVKQLGACASDPENGLAGAGLHVPDEASPLVSRRLKDEKGGDMAEWPTDIRVRQLPEARHV